MVPLLEVKSFETITRELLADLTDEEKSLGRLSIKGAVASVNIFYWLNESFHKPIWGNIHRKYHNMMMRFGMYMIQNYPLLAWWKFGFDYQPTTG